MKPVSAPEHVHRPDHVSAAPPPTTLQSTTDSSCAASSVFGCLHTAGGLIEVATLMFGDAAVDDLVLVSGRQPS